MVGGIEDFRRAKARNFSSFFFKQLGERGFSRKLYSLVFRINFATHSEFEDNFVVFCNVFSNVVMESIDFFFREVTRVCNIDNFLLSMREVPTAVR